MEDEQSIVERIIAGEASVKDYDPDSDFNDEELHRLLDEGIIEPKDLSDWRASDMVINDMLSYGEYPFEKFSNYEKVRQLEQQAISREDFKVKAELEYFDGDDWLTLLNVWTELNPEAPWDMIRNEAHADSWLDFLMKNPDFSGKADWKRLLKEGSMKKYFKMLEKQPALYEHCPAKQKLLEADSRYWVDLLIKQPDFAKIYPMKDLDEVDEVEHLLLHRPEFTEMLTWDKENPPVKLFIENKTPEVMKFFPEDAKHIPTEISSSLRIILQKILYYEEQDAEDFANIIGHSQETFAGIYSTKTAESMVRIFRETIEFTKLPLTIKMEQ